MKHVKALPMIEPRTSDELMLGKALIDSMYLHNVGSMLAQRCSL